MNLNHFVHENFAWLHSFRIISAHRTLPEIFNRVCDPRDMEAMILVESKTNPDVMMQVGTLDLVPFHERVAGPGSAIRMTAFTHLNPDGSRFSDGTYGVYYCAREIETAIEETKYHRIRFLKQTSQRSGKYLMDVYRASIYGDFCNILGLQDTCRELYDPDPANYFKSQSFAKNLRANGLDGIVYDSVRRDKGQCAAVFRPNIITSAVAFKTYEYIWDGTEILHYEKERLILPSPDYDKKRIV